MRNEKKDKIREKPEVVANVHMTCQSSGHTSSLLNTICNIDKLNVALKPMKT